MNLPHKHELQPEEVVRLAALFDYTTDSIVSRTLLKREHGSITLFAFDEGQGLSEHSSPADAFAYFLDGELELVIAGKRRKAQAGDAILLPANQPHALKAVTRCKMLLIMLRS